MIKLKKTQIWSNLCNGFAAVSPGITLALLLSFLICDQVNEAKNKPNYSSIESKISKVMQKAEFVDGVPGISFKEKETLARAFGYTGPIFEGEKVSFDYYHQGEKLIPGYNGNGYYIFFGEKRSSFYKIPEEAIRNYLEEN
ncbi:MAG: hypothetical protein ABH817_02620 [archaeon]